jgi:hypothetical protein
VLPEVFESCACVLRASVVCLHDGAVAISYPVPIVT